MKFDHRSTSSTSLIRWWTLAASFE